MFGDGSDGAFNPISDTTLELDRKYQFTTVNIPSGVTVSSTGVGSVLYILANTSVNIAGSLTAEYPTRGQVTRSITIDGTLYTNPSVASGGKGGDDRSSTTGRGGAGALGFGGGGSGGSSGSTDGVAGNGGSGGLSPTAGTGGSSVGATDVGQSGTAGAQSGGGGGGANSQGIGFSGTIKAGNGGSAHGSNGGNATMTVPGSGPLGAGGGGGAGGNAATPGVHVVIKSPSITATGTIVTRKFDSKDGQKGGNGGAGAVNGGYDQDARAGAGGGGGGGANAGNLYYTTYADGLTDSAIYGMTGGNGGAIGTGQNSGTAGTAGSDGEVVHNSIAPPAPRTYHLVKYYDGTKWVIGRAKGSIQSQWKESTVEATITE